MQQASLELAERAAQQAVQLAPRLHRWAEIGVRARHGDMSFRQFQVLAALAEGSTTMGEVAHHLMVTPAVMTGIVDRLERHGYIRRTTTPGDRRRVYLEMTEAGRGISLAAERQLVAELTSRLGHVSEADLSALVAGLAILGEVMLAIAPESDSARS